MPDPYTVYINMNGSAGREGYWETKVQAGSDEEAQNKAQNIATTVKETDTWKVGTVSIKRD